MFQWRARCGMQTDSASRQSGRNLACNVWGTLLSNWHRWCLECQSLLPLKSCGLPCRLPLFRGCPGDLCPRKPCSGSLDLVASERRVLPLPFLRRETKSWRRSWERRGKWVACFAHSVTLTWPGRCSRFQKGVEAGLQRASFSWFWWCRSENALTTLFLKNDFIFQGGNIQRCY